MLLAGLLWSGRIEVKPRKAPPGDWVKELLNG